MAGGESGTYLRRGGQAVCGLVTKVLVLFDFPRHCFPLEGKQVDSHRDHQSCSRLEPHLDRLMPSLGSLSLLVW